MQVTEIKISEIATSALNPRKTFDEDSLAELAQSIKENGLIQPVTLRPIDGAGEAKYEIVCGERRYRAVQSLGQETIQAVVKELDDRQAFACMVIENLQRKDIDPLEEAQALKHLNTKGEVPIKEIAKLLGKSASYVFNRIQLNNISDEFVKLWRDGILGLGHLQEISKLTFAQQKDLHAECFKPQHIEQWSFRTLKMPVLKEWIDNYVMGTLSSARFDPKDETYSYCKACEGCRFCTTTYPSRFKDEPARCMNIVNYKFKNMEAVLRQAKESNAMVVYAGEVDDKSGIMDAARARHIDVQPIGQREYVPVPSKENYGKKSSDDKDGYIQKVASYERMLKIFNDNVEAGNIVKVFEISNGGILTGVDKYLYNVQRDKAGRPNKEQADINEQLRTEQAGLSGLSDDRKEYRVESQRAYLASEEYAKPTGEFAADEESIFLALLATRLPAGSRASVGLDEFAFNNIDVALERVTENKIPIMREFIRAMLADKQVCYSEYFSTLLAKFISETVPAKAAEIDQLTQSVFDKKQAEYESRIADLEAKLKIAQAENGKDEPAA